LPIGNSAYEHIRAFKRLRRSTLHHLRSSSFWTQSLACDSSGLCLLAFWRGFRLAESAN